MDTSTFTYSAGVAAHLVYFGVAIAAGLVFVAIYVAVTPHRLRSWPSRHYLKRLAMIDMAFGNADFHRDRFIALSPEDGVPAGAAP